MKNLKVVVRAVPMLVSAFMLFNFSSARAAEMLDTENPNCHFQAYRGGKWVQVQGSEVPTETFTKKTPSKTQPGVSVTKLNGAWYSYNNSCAVPVAGSEEGGASADVGEHPWFAELSLVYPKAMGDNVSGGTTVSGSTTTTTSAYSNKISWGLRVGKRLNANSSLSVLFNHYGGGQDATLSASGQTGTSTSTDSFSLFGLGYRHFFSPGSTFNFFVEGDLGYGSSSGTVTITGFTGGLTTANGTVEASTSSLWYGLRVGGEWKVSERINILPFVGYEKFSGGTWTVKTSTLTALPVGSTINASATGWLTFGANVQYSF